MRKRVIVGDMHGMFGIVKDIYDLEQPDDFMILGDYFDSFTIAPNLQELAYKDLLELRRYHKSLHKGKFIMLIGNHDLHYLPSHHEQCSGYNKDTAWFATDLIRDGLDREYLHFAHIDITNKIIFTHAGVTQTWFMKWCYPSLNNINTVDFPAFRHVGSDLYGNDKRNSPIWVRPEALESDPYIDNNGYIWSQIFGHTHQKEPFMWSKADPTDPNQYGQSVFIGIDCITTYYIVEELDDNGKLIKRHIRPNKNIVM